MASSSAPAISIIIATKGREDFLQSLLASIRRQSFRDYEVLIVSPDPITSDGPEIKVILQRGEGLANARNLGLREARGEIILFLDDDVELQDNYLSGLNNIMREHPEIAGTGGVSTLMEPIISHPILPPLLDFFTGRRLGSADKIGRVLTNGFTAPNFEYATKPMQVEWLRGSNMALRSNITKSIGPFDENYEGNGLYEDADYGYRCTLRGYRLLLDPSLKQKHQSRGTPLYPEERYAYYMAYNQIYFFYKFRWDGPLRLARCLLAQLFLNSLYLIGGLVYRKPQAFFAHTRGLFGGFNRLQRVAESSTTRENVS